MNETEVILIFMLFMYLFEPKCNQVFRASVNFQENTARKKRHFPQNIHKLECGLMPNVMAALPNIGGALCSTSQSLADAHY